MQRTVYFKHFIMAFLSFPIIFFLVATFSSEMIIMEEINNDLLIFTILVSVNFIINVVIGKIKKAKNEKACIEF